MFKAIGNWVGGVMDAATRKYETVGTGYSQKKKVTYEPTNWQMLKAALLVGLLACLFILSVFVGLFAVITVMGLYSLWLIPFIGIAGVTFAILKTKDGY